MRSFAGYFVVITFVGIFFTVVLLASEEINKAHSFHKVLEETVSADQLQINKTSLLLDANGKVFSEVNRPFRLYVHDEEIPSYLKDVLIASEDQHFYEHVGFDAGAILRALVKNLVFTHLQQGGSTITQQLARNLYLGQEKTYNRKLTELFYAHEIEKSLTKDEILELYLNVIYFSNGVYGIETASQYYFQKSIGDLNKAELTFLASIPNNPGKYDPIDHFDQTKIRQERLIDILVDNDKLSKEEGNKLKKVSIRLNVRKKIDAYPDYAFYVEEELKDLIAVSEGYTVQLKKAKSTQETEQIVQKLNKRVEEVIRSGVTIHTALNRDLQQKSVDALNSQLTYDGLEGASVTIDNTTRNIVSITGGKNYKKYNFHHSFQAFRQPGSVIKPLLVYGPYLKKYNSSIYAKINANTYCIESYCPVNYGGAQPGMVTLNQALAHSYNTPAVRLLEKTGIDTAFKSLSAFSFQKLTKKDHTYAAAVGGFTYGMSPLELTDAYTSFVDGTYTKSHAIRKITDSKGNTLYKWEEKPTTVWSKDTTSKIRTMLSTAAQSGTGRWANVAKPYVGIKTGTTNNYNDYWVMGLTNQYTTGVWVGHDTPKNMSSIERLRPSHNIWKQIMR
jgi:penicillin-binding protein 4